MPSIKEDIFGERVWYDALARLHRHITLDDFDELLVSALNMFTKHEHTVITAYPDGGQPYLCFDDLPSHQVEPTIDRYLKGAYLLDPFYMACQGSKRSTGVWKLRQLAPDQFYASEYYRVYYAATKLTEEVGLFCDVGEDTTVVISLGIRTQRVRLTTQDIQRLESVFPLVQAFYRSHFAGLANKPARTPPEDRPSFGKSLDLVFQNFGRDHLSIREMEIVQLILRGHSSRSIGERLHISADTVKAHRKHIHAKLKVSSQAELFSLFLDALAVMPMNSMADPLSLLNKGS